MGLDEQIVTVDKLIEARPDDASLYLRRGELHRLHQDWSAAEKDYLTARKLAPDMTAVEFCLGRLNLDAGKPAQAKEHFDRYLAERPADGIARVERARALVSLGKPLAAVADYDAALAASSPMTPQPEHYLERARALMAAGPENVERAIAGLDEGLSRLGDPVTLELYAIDLEVKSKRYDPALVRIDRLAAQSTRKEPWLMRRGAILEAAGRKAEALRAYRQALSAVESLPASRRGSRAVARLEAEARSAVARLEDVEHSIQ
jgi:tetratricopeptide (TPR) repeat protein